MSDKVFTMEDDLTGLTFDYKESGLVTVVTVLKDEGCTLSLTSYNRKYKHDKADFIQDIKEGCLVIQNKEKVYTEEDVVVGLSYKCQDATITITEVYKGQVKVAEMPDVFTVSTILKDINRKGTVVTVPTVTDSQKPIKSDGGSSSYYDITLTKKVVDFIISRTKEDGSSMIKTEELIEALGSDFDVGNILKCTVRINSLKNGCGKEGNDVKYDANKIKYSANRLIERDKE